MKQPITSWAEESLRPGEGLLARGALSAKGLDYKRWAMVTPTCVAVGFVAFWGWALLWLLVAEIAGWNDPSLEVVLLPSLATVVGWYFLLRWFFAYHYRYSALLLTSERAVFERAWPWSRKAHELLLAEVESVELVQSWLGQQASYGALTLAGRGHQRLLFEPVDDPLSFKRQVDAALEWRRNAG